MNVTLYQNSSPKEQLTKTLTLIASLDGTLREVCSIVTPVITLEKDSPIGFNYAYIADYGRYYFVTEVEVVRKGLIRLHLKSDPLMSFASSIKANSGIIRKSASNYNVKINDNSLRSYQNDLYTYKKFSGGFGTNFEYVLLVAGQ